MSLEPNTRLGPYEILGLLGAGGMGEVYKGRDTRLGRLVAIKVTNKHLDGRFEREARAISALNHPNICTLYDVGPNYLVMELVEGETLAARLRGGPIALDQVVRLATEIADALAEAHGLGMIHRDLKPANIMITPSGRVKLLDFGLAKLMQDPDPEATLTVEGAVLGTFAYMSPEQLQGKPADVRSDVFAFGAVLYEMLSGQRAFATAVLRDEPKSLTGVSFEAVQVVTRCLSRNPDERYARIVDVKSALERIGHGKPAGDGPSIAVLPFANMSADKENEYFSDGLAEEILNALTRVPGLKVTARTSAFAFRGKEQDIRRIGEALDVKTVLEGSVRRAGNRIRVTAQLINVSDGYHLWSERYDREMDDVFAVQDEISQAIVETLKVQLAGKPSAPVRHTPNIEAYHAFLKGRHHLFKLNPEDTMRSGSYFEQAVALDPQYAMAHVGLANFYVLKAIAGKSPHEMMPLAKAAALKAVELDPNEGDAHEVLARVAAVFDYDWTEALRRWRLTLACEPVSPEARAGGALAILIPLGRFDDALAQARQALAMDPLSPLPHMAASEVLFRRGAYEPAIEGLQRLRELQPGVWISYLMLGGIFHTMKRIPEAIATLERGLEVAPWNGAIVGMLAANYALAGDPRAEGMRARVEASEPSFRTLGRFFFYLMSSDLDRAADYFEEIIEARFPMAPTHTSLPFFDSFRKTPRGQALLEKMNLKGIVP